MQSMRNIADYCKGQLLVIIIIIILLFSTMTYGGSKMEPLYDVRDAIELQAQMFSTIRHSILSLFTVPQDNSIGTNDMNNAITLMSFSKGKIKYDTYFKNAVDNLEGGGEYIPIIAEDTIGFGQTRRFLLYNFSSKSCQNYRITVSLEKSIERIAIANARQKNFIFQVQKQNSQSDDAWDFTTSLLLMNLSEKEAKLIKEITKEKGVTWSVVSDHLFLYAREKEKLQVLNMDFKPAHHPLEDVINRNKGKLGFSRIYAHPYLPIAILMDGKSDEMIISWGQGRDHAPTSLFGETAAATLFSFSPDGKWVTFQNRFPEPKKTYLMPVSEKYPHYLGSPILISDTYFNDNNFAWTTNPISFVGSSDGKLYRWELTNAAHPESDKATFHDYIVEHDLEKLTREKRQGLGDTVHK